jgi:hypothetical protein
VKLAMLNSTNWVSLSLIIAVLVAIISGCWVGGTLGGTLIGGALSVLGAFGAQWLTWARERTLKVAEIQRQAIYELQDALSEALRKLPDARKANAVGQADKDQSAIDFCMILHDINKLSSRIKDENIKVLCDDYSINARTAFNDDKLPSGYVDVETKLKEINKRVRELMPALFET